MEVWGSNLFQCLLQMCDEKEYFQDSIVQSDEATFKLKGTINRHNCVWWANENKFLIEEKAGNVPGVTVWFGRNSRELIGPCFFEETVAG